MKNGKFKLNIQESDIKKQIVDLLDIFKVLADAKNILLKYEFDESIPDLLLIDESRIK